MNHERLHLTVNFSPVYVQKQPLPEVKRMTLVAALTAPHCGIMFADSQETVAGYAKKSVDKLQYDPMGNGYFRFALGGASDNGPYIDMFNFELEGVLRKTQSSFIGDIYKAVEEFTLDFHKRHIWPQKEPPRMETLVMIQPVDVERKLFHGVDLIHISQTAVSPLINSDSKAIGIGSYLADYIFEKLDARAALDATHLLAIAVYILQQVKMHVDGVGLNGKIVMFNKDGTLEEFEQSDIDPFEKLMGDFDYASQEIFRTFSKSGESKAEKFTKIARELKRMKSEFVRLWNSIEGNRNRAVGLSPKRDLRLSE